MQLEKYGIPSVRCYELQQGWKWILVRIYGSALVALADRSQCPNRKPVRNGEYYTVLTRDAACINTPGVVETQIPVDKDHQIRISPYNSLVALRRRHIAAALGKRFPNIIAVMFFFYTMNTVQLTICGDRTALLQHLSGACWNTKTNYPSSRCATKDWCRWRTGALW